MLKTILVDTSVWINFFNDKHTKVSFHLKNIFSTTRIATCPVVVQEVLQGARSEKDFNLLIGDFDEMVQLPGNAYELAIEAAQLYRKGSVN